MRNVENIQILELFVHILDNRAQQLFLSDFPIDIAGNQTLCNYFTDHIRVSLKEPAAKASRFRNINPAQTSGICGDILSNQSSLLTGSKRIAECLYDVIRADQRISPADMAVCLYEDLDQASSRYLAMMKIDPSKVFEHTVSQEPGGIRITYQLSDQALTQEKLQKCAFIRPLQPRHLEYDLLVLDRQTGSVGDGSVAKFFADRFLDSCDAFDSLSRTKLLYNILIGTHKEIRDELPAEINQDLDQRILMAVRNRVINTDHWVDELPVDETVRQHFRQALQEQLPDVEFEIDQQIAQRMTRRIYFEGDYGLKVSIPSANLEDIIESESVFRTPDGEVKHRITIVTKAWSKVAR